MFGCLCMWSILTYRLVRRRVQIHFHMQEDIQKVI